MAEDLLENEVAIVSCGTTAGDIVLEFNRQWSPHGYDRAVELFEEGFYDHSHFFRTVPGFLVQFGISYSKDKNLVHMAKTTIKDDPQLEPPIKFEEGTISYAGGGPNSRTSQLFFSLSKTGGNFGRELWETPVGKVVEGMDNVRAFYGGYGDMPPWGQGPVQGKIHTEGEAYMVENFPKTDRFTTCRVERKRGGETESHRRAQNRKHHPHRKEARSEIHTLRKPPNVSHKKHSVKHEPHHHQQQQHHTVHHDEPEHVTGQFHHQRGIHINPAPDEEGLTKLSWELLGSCLVLFLAVLALWLRFALCTPKKSRKTH